eukprot:5553652-Amphidinium_carterae.1
MLSGRSTVVAAFRFVDVESVLAAFRARLGLADDGTTMELWHASERVPDRVQVRNFPGLQPPGEISEYQLLIRR